MKEYLAAEVMPPIVEICARIKELKQPCLGVIFRMGPDGTDPYCVKCSSREPGVIYAQRKTTKAK